MKRWGALVAGLYVLALAALTWPVLAVSFAGEDPTVSFAHVYLEPGYWAIIAVLAICQFGLVLIPVGTMERPTSRRSILYPLIAAGLAMGALIAGGVASIFELAAREKGLEAFPIAVGIGLLSWAIWSWVFYRRAQGATPSNVAEQQASLLFRGSVLELLVAVPTHIVARSRGYCCAGVMTFVGITMGLAIMLMSFGPAIYFLYSDRWRRLHPKRN